MKVEKDFIQREIQRLTLFLTRLIDKALGLDAHDFEQELQNIELDLRNEFGLTLREISEMDNLGLMKIMERSDGQHLEKLAELIAAITGNSQKEFGGKLAEKGIVILDFLDNSSKTYSLKRMELRKTLQQ